MTPESQSDLVAEIQSQGATLESRRRTWEPFWDELVEFCFPARQFYGPKSEGKPKQPKVNYNNRAALAVNKASAGFQGYTANGRSLWFKLQFEDLALMEEYMVADWLESCERILYAHFGRSGLYEALGEMVPDGHVIGTSTMYIEDIGGGRMTYQTRHPLAVWISENSYGEVDTVYEEIYMTNKAIKERFGEERLSDKRREDAKKNPYGMSTVRHIVKPMDERFMQYAQKPFDREMGFLSIWYDEPERVILDVGGYWEFPFAVWRTRKNSGEEYGRAQAHDALGDVLAGNQMTKSRLKLGNIIADPTLLVDSGLEGQDTILPGAHIYRDSREDTIEPVPLGANYPITIDNENRQDALIDEHFSIPIYLMLQQMEREMTAREVVERTGEKAAILGPQTSRYEREVLRVTIRRTFNLLLRAGKLPPPPPAVLEAGPEASMKVEFLGLLAQLQQRYYQTNGINAGLGYIQAIGQMFPQATDYVDQDRLLVEGMESVGMPASIIREKDDVLKIRAERLRAQAAQAQAAAQQQQDQAMLQNMDKLGKKPEDGSPLTNMAQVLAQQGVQR